MSMQAFSSKYLFDGEMILEDKIVIVEDNKILEICSTLPAQDINIVDCVHDDLLPRQSIRVKPYSCGKEPAFFGMQPEYSIVIGAFPSDIPSVRMSQPPFAL